MSEIRDHKTLSSVLLLERGEKLNPSSYLFQVFFFLRVLLKDDFKADEQHLVAAEESLLYERKSLYF